MDPLADPLTPKQRAAVEALKNGEATKRPKRYSEQQEKILALLSDGRPHRREEIWLIMGDELAPMQYVRNWISRLRTKLPPNEIIVCELYQGTIHYRHCRLLGGYDE